MYGDPDAIRRLARALRERADAIRDEADRLAARAGATAWTGTAGGAMRSGVRSGAGALRRTASLHDDAAEALERHASAASGVLEEIATIEHAFTHALGEAAHAIETPVHGSLEWLHMHVPHWLGGAA